LDGVQCTREVSTHASTGDVTAGAHGVEHTVQVFAQAHELEAESLVGRRRRR
jgi:hypothetical protein